MDVPLQKSLIHVQTWRFATFWRSRRLRLNNLPEVYSQEGKNVGIMHTSSSYQMF